MWQVQQLLQTLWQAPAATQSSVTGTAVTQNPVTGTADEPEDQSVSVSVTPMQEKKAWKQKSACLVREDEKAGPSQEEEEEESKMVTTCSLSMGELWDTQKDFCRCPGKHNVTWLLQCWDNKPNSLEWEGKEGSSWDPFLGKEVLTKRLEKGHKPSVSGHDSYQA